MSAHLDKQTNRVDWIDIAKGIAILLVILGHTVGFDTNIGNITRGIIFSFHMPLFFILSCVTFKLSVDNNQFVNKTEKAFRHLIVPAIVLFVLQIMIYIIESSDAIEWKSYIVKNINIFVYGSGVPVNVMGASVPAIGIPWFLMALFLGRSLFDYLHLKLDKTHFKIAIIICTLVGIAFGKLQWLPFSFDIALAVMPFFYMGNFLKTVDMDKRTLQYGCISFFIWVATFILCYSTKNTYMELACRRYALFPICYVTAISATMFISYFGKIVENLKIMKPLMYLGRNSMYMLWVHIMDYNFKFAWDRTNNNFIDGILRIIVDIVLFMIFMQILNLLKKVKKRKSV